MAYEKGARRFRPVGSRKKKTAPKYGPTGTGCPVVVVANKLDKLKKSEIDPNLQVIRDTLELSEQDCLVPFSAEKGTGKTELLSAISQRLGV